MEHEDERDLELEEVLDRYRIALAKIAAERPIHPSFAPALNGWVDPTARESQAESRRFSVEERTLMNAIGFMSNEGMFGVFTPLGAIETARAALGIIAATDDELENGYQGIAVDPYGEVKDIPLAAREQFERALWHLDEGIKQMGLTLTDGGSYVATVPS